VIGKKKLEKTISDSDTSATFDVKLPKGNTNVRAWLVDKKGNKRGAYYIYAKKISK
jgi:hypothetical protein